MTQIFEATFDGVVFRPDEKVEIKPNTRVRLVVKIEGGAERTVGDVAGHLFGSIDTDAPADVSINKKYLEGFGE
jgi:predicted DNA-binding antitoxin AbrB/MazE fold protein